MTPAELRAFVEAATPGPWVARGEVIGSVYSEPTGDSVADETTLMDFEDARLIALAPQLATLLADMAEVLEAGYSVDDGEGDTFTSCGACHEITWQGHAPDCLLNRLKELDA